MFKGIFLQLEGEEQAFDFIMEIGEFFQGFHEGLVGLASSVFGVFGF